MSAVAYSAATAAAVAKRSAPAIRFVVTGPVIVRWPTTRPGRSGFDHPIRVQMPHLADSNPST